MLVKLKNTLLAFYRKTTESIAFLPTLISLAMIFFAMAALVAEKYGATSFLQEHLNILVTYSEDNARTILSVLIGGIISLTVFSFSMVMILLNQAASSFSPRLLPGLISSKSHQYVLGTYIGTILFCLIVLINVYKPNEQALLPVVAILVAIFLGVLCLGMFVYFIHNISTSIQASNVIFKIFSDTRRDLEELQAAESRALQMDKDFKTPSVEYPIFSNQTGYLQGISKESLLGIAIKNDFVINMEVTRGMFVLKNIPIAKSNKELEEETIEEVLSCFRFSNQELVRDNYLLGFKHLTEVVVKAMSPGINDPGTAMTAIDFLSELLAIRMTISDREFLVDEDGERRVFFNTATFEKVIYNILAAIRQYAKHDVVVVTKLLTMLHYLRSQKGAVEVYQQVVKKEIETLLEDAYANIKNEKDQAAIKELIAGFGI
ncbi:MAG: DUF2254 domain-containing protein [Saprospiraceae bacterium]